VKVGSTIFRKGISVSTVLMAARRAYQSWSAPDSSLDELMSMTSAEIQKVEALIPSPEVERKYVPVAAYRQLQKEVALLWQDRQKNVEIPLPTFQQRLSNWVLHCFGAKIRSDKRERDMRFLEEALELVQARGNVSLKDAVAMVHYVYSRPKGEVAQEVGGVMTCLAALVATEQHPDGTEMDMMEEGEKELTRIWDHVEKIRQKQKLKPH
jgi:hypothetical protein